MAGRGLEITNNECQLSNPYTDSTEPAKIRFIDPYAFGRFKAPKGYEKNTNYFIHEGRDRRGQSELWIGQKTPQRTTVDKILAWGPLLVTAINVILYFWDQFEDKVEAKTESNRKAKVNRLYAGMVAVGIRLLLVLLRLVSGRRGNGTWAELIGVLVDIGVMVLRYTQNKDKIKE